jgi:hypothetical protein
LCKVWLTSSYVDVTELRRIVAFSWSHILLYEFAKSFVGCSRFTCDQLFENGRFLGVKVCHIHSSPRSDHLTFGSDHLTLSSTQTCLHARAT